MSSNDDPKPRRKVRTAKLVRPDIKVDDDVLTPRDALAQEIGITPRSGARMNWLTTYIGGIAYVPRNKTLRGIADSARQRHQPGRSARRSTQTVA